MAYEHSYTGQMPRVGFGLGCLLVKNDGTPVGAPFTMREFEDRSVSQLARSIKEEDLEIPPNVHFNSITLWKTEPPERSFERRECATFESAWRRTRCDGAGQNPPTWRFIFSKRVTGGSNPRHRPAPIGQGEFYRQISSTTYVRVPARL
jgi:hypothetical protein